MKKGIFVAILIVTIALVAVSATGFLMPKAYAADALALTGLTALDAEGNPYTYTAGGKWGREITLAFTLDSDRYSVAVRRNDANPSTLIYYSGILTDNDGAAEYKLLFTGNLTVFIETYTHNAIENTLLSTITVDNLLSDNEAPTTPDIEMAQFDVFWDEYDGDTLKPYTVSFNVADDPVSGLNFEKSCYWYEAAGGGLLLNKTKITSADTFHAPLRGNGTLVIYLEDEACNGVSYRYTYERYGTPDVIIPFFAAEPTAGWTKSVNVAISWGALNDQNPKVYKYYQVFADDKAVTSKRRYESAFVVTNEGEITVRAYYIDGEVEKYVATSFNNIDRSIPYLSGDPSVTIDLTKANPVTLTVRVRDRAGIARVYDKLYGTDFTSIGNEYYTLPLTTTTVTIVMVDGAGNSDEYIYSRGLNFALIATYSQKIRAFVPALYATGVAEELSSVAAAFANLLLFFNPTTSEIAQYTTKIDALLEGALIVKTVINAAPDGISTVLSYGAVQANFVGGIKLRETVTMYIDLAKLTDLADAVALVKVLAGDNYAAYGFNLSLKDSAGAALSIAEPIEVDMAMPNGYSSAAATVYYMEGGVLVNVTLPAQNKSYVRYKYKGSGDYFLAYNVNVKEGETPPKGITIGGKIYSYAMLGITAGVIAVVIAGAVVVVNILSKRKGGRR